MRRSIVFLTFTLVFSPLGAQEEPMSPGIVLPKLMLEVEDIQLTNIEAILPTQDELGSPRIELPLPEPEDLTIDMSSLSMGSSTAVLPETGGEPLVPYYAAGAIGAGSMNYLLGELELSLPGSNPAFDLRFSHQGADGYWTGESYQSAGSGSYYRQEDFEGSLQWSQEALSVEGEISFLEREDGLQNYGGTGAFEALKSRDWQGIVSMDWALSPAWSLTGLVHYTGEYNILTGGNPQDFTENKIRIGAGARWAGKKHSLQLVPLGQYWGVKEGDEHIAALSVEAKGSWGGLGYQLNGEGGWDFNDGYWSPFRLDLTYATGFNWGLSLWGERVQKYYSTALQDQRFSHPTEKLKPVDGWGGGIAGRYQWKDWNLSLSVPYYLYATREVSTGEIDPETGLFLSVTDEGPQITPQLALGYDKGGFYGDFSLSTTFLEDTSWADTTSIGLDLGYDGPGPWGLTWSNWYVLQGEEKNNLPQSQLEGYYKINEGLLLALVGEDLLSPFMDEGRRIHETYLEPGVLMNFQVRISF